MLKEKLIPTPLVVHKVRNDEYPAPVRFRSLFVLGLILRALWFVLMIRYRPNGKYTMLSLAKMTTSAFERLGGLWVKVAQILAMRRDIFSREFCDELSRLHDRAHGFPGEIARRIIEEELGKPIDEIFKDFKTTPLAAASIGQVHVAYLIGTGKKVAIKVQRPSIAYAFAKDLEIIDSLLGLLRVFRIMPWAGWDDMFDALRQTLVDELDYRIEVGSMRRMRRLLKAEKIVSPKAYTKFCTRRVLTMEFLDGVLMSDYVHVFTSDPKRAKAWCKENDIKPKKFGSKLYLSFWKQLLEDNVLHGDLHPGNIMMLRRSRIAYIDFGSITVMDAAFITKYNVTIRALANKDFSKYAESFFTMSPNIPMNVDLNKMRKEVVRVAENWEALSDAKQIPYEQRALTTLLASLLIVVGNHKVMPEWASLRMLRTMTALDASLRFVIPQVSFFKLIWRHYEKQNWRTVKYMMKKRSRVGLALGLNSAAKLPLTIGENLFFQGDLIRKRALSFQAGISKAAQIGAVVVGMLLNVGFIVTVFISARYISKQHDVGTSTIAQLPVRDIFSSIPSLSPGLWVLVIIMSLYFLRSLRRLAQLLNITSPGTNPFIQGGGG